MVTAPSPSPQKEKTNWIFNFFFFFLVTQAHLDHPLGFIWDLQFGSGIDHLVDLIPDESFADHPFLSLVLNLDKFNSVVLFSSRGTVLYLLLY